MPAKFYAVRNGIKPGVYATWDECLQQTKGFPKAIFKKFPTRAEADAFVKAPVSDGYGPSKAISAKKRAAEDEAPDSTSPYFPSASIPADPPTHSSSIDTAPLSFKRPRIDVSSSSSTASSITNPVPTRTIAAAAKKAPKPSTAFKPTQLSSDGYTRLKRGRIVVFTDGSSLGNGKVGAKAGAGVFWGDGHPRNAAVRVPGAVQTNNRGELLAIAIALERAPQDGCPLEIRSDSKYSISSLTEWLPGWRRNKFRSSSGKDVLNKDIIQHIAILLDIRRSAQTSSIDQSQLPKHQFDTNSESETELNFEPSSSDAAGAKKKKKTKAKDWEWDGERSKGAVRFVWVRAHEGTHGNEMADALANEGARLPISTVNPTYLTPTDFAISLKAGHPRSFAGLNLSYAFPSLTPSPASAPLPTRKRDSSHSEIDDDLTGSHSEYVGSSDLEKANRAAEGEAFEASFERGRDGADELQFDAWRERRKALKLLEPQDSESTQEFAPRLTGDNLQRPLGRGRDRGTEEGSS